MDQNKSIRKVWIKKNKWIKNYSKNLVQKLFKRIKSKKEISSFGKPGHSERSTGLIFQDMYLFKNINWADHLSILQHHVQMPPPSPEDAGQPVSAQSGWDQPDSIQPERVQLGSIQASSSQPNRHQPFRG